MAQAHANPTEAGPALRVPPIEESIRPEIRAAKDLPDGVPPPETVAEWKQKYLAIWEACIDGLSPEPNYKRQRREVLVATFERVERLARGRYEGKSYPDVRSYIADRFPRESDKPDAEPGAAADGGRDSGS